LIERALDQVGASWIAGLINQFQGCLDALNRLYQKPVNILGCRHGNPCLIASIRSAFCARAENSKQIRRDVYWVGLMAFASAWAALNVYGYCTGFFS
jgi:hypothetical protein